MQFLHVAGVLTAPAPAVPSLPAANSTTKSSWSHTKRSVSAAIESYTLHFVTASSASRPQPQLLLWMRAPAAYASAKMPAYLGKLLQKYRGGRRQRTSRRE